MIAYDGTSDGVLFAAFTVQNGDTAKIYRSTDGGNTWAYWNAISHAGNVLSSLELVVAEGDSDFVFFFVKSSAGNGDIYVGRWDISGSGGAIYNVKVDSDTVANVSACRDLDGQYYLYVAYESRAGNYNMEEARSTNYGKTWAATGGSVVNNQTSPKPDICHGNGGNIYIVLRDLRLSSTDSASFRVKRSTNRGTSWQGSEQVGTPGVTIADPVVGAKHSSGTVWLVHARNMTTTTGWDIYCYSSVDSGQSWNLRNVANTDSAEQMPSIASYRVSGAVTLCYSVTPGESIMFTWASIDTNWTTPVRISDHRSTGGFAPQAGWMTVGASYSCVLYAGYTALGLYFDGFNMTGVGERRPVADAARPAAPAARPSPARNRTVISYGLPSAGWARVSVSDIAGREVAILSSGTRAAGTHSAIWNCEAVPAGVYLVRVETSTGSQTGRVIVSH
ncbi:T9SS type A sorting domain-containing protein [candidate division WOR-3 bacterium]|uniref:T9SS type A sorting domain-containing protein n=1 Tax=candidate division WOR-3 bacterium TaxID=2052148 RepID=A0A937XHE6_UNCW3|nr:T9SS type A sorting domain-containing protein [candidate division WOR-3 bacterium]